MVEDQDKRLEAVYTFKKRLENAQKRLLRDRGIHEENKQKILQFIKHLKSKGRSDPTQIKYLIRLTRLASMLGKEFSKIAPTLPVGYSIFHLADMGDPFVAAWRPTYSQS